MGRGREKPERDTRNPTIAARGASWILHSQAATGELCTKDDRETHASRLRNLRRQTTLLSVAAVCSVGLAQQQASKASKQASRRARPRETVAARRANLAWICRMQESGAKARERSAHPLLHPRRSGGAPQEEPSERAAAATTGAQIPGTKQPAPAIPHCTHTPGIRKRCTRARPPPVSSEALSKQEQRGRESLLSKNA